MMMRFDGSVPFFEESCSGFFFCSKKELFLSLSRFCVRQKKLVVFQFLSSERYSPVSYPLEILS
jgi:hypothetical protein